MDLDLSTWLLALPVAFVLGWIASRLDMRQLRIESRTHPKAYFKGLNHLLNEQQDQAIDAFIEAVQLDPDTSELHFALGNLFRRRGEYERAVRVHQHLLSRGDLSKADRERAQHALAMDYLKAGILDRAQGGFEALIHTPLAGSAHLALLSIYERTQEWANAERVANDLDQTGQASFAARRAHYLCELASDPALKDDAQRQAWLTEAIAIAPQAARARIMMAESQLGQGQPDAAAQTLTLLHEQSPAHLGLACGLLTQLAQSPAHQPLVLRLLRENHAQTQSLDVLQTLLQLIQNEQPEVAQQLLADHLQHTPSLSLAAQWLATESLSHPDMHAVVQRAIEQAAQPMRRYRCAACGFEANRHFWHCPGCQAWDSFPPRRIEER